MIKLIKTNWPLWVLAAMALAIMFVIVDMKKNDLPKIKEKERLEQENAR